MIIKRSQSSFEYLTIIALTLAIIVPTAYLFFRYSNESTTELLDSQINKIGKEIVDTAEIVYFSGEGSKLILNLNMPEEVTDINILSNRELVFTISTGMGESEAIFFSSVNINSSSCSGSICSLSDIVGVGLRKVKLQAYCSPTAVKCPDYVKIG